jgi:hypothetical protein
MVIRVWGLGKAIFKPPNWLPFGYVPLLGDFTYCKAQGKIIVKQ